VFKCRLLRNISGPKKEVLHLTGDWKKSCNEELQELYSSSSIRVVKFKENKMDGGYDIYGGRGDGKLYTV
jgi:hypothetical protein